VKILRSLKKINVKLVLAFLLIGIVPLVISGLISSQKSNTALTSASFNQLTGIREIKKSQIESFFKERQGDMQVLMETVGTLRREAFSKLKAIQQNKKKALKQLSLQWQTDIVAQQRNSICTKGMMHYQARFKSGYISRELKSFASVIDAFINATGYYDFIIIDMDGVVVHTQAQKADYKTNLITGPYKDSGLAHAFNKASKGETILTDFVPYAPRNNEPAAFLAAPILSGEQQTGVVVLQISMEKLQSIMDERTGLGKTGETYLVGQDKLMRSDSFKASFANPEKGKVDTEATRWALAGEDKIDVIIDYNGNPVLSAASPLNIMGLKWAILTEIDLAEAFVPVDEEGKEYYKKYVDTYGYYDLFLINLDGYCFYSAAKKAEYQTNFQKGKYAESNLGKLFRGVKESKLYGVADFEPYAPSNGEPAAFIAQPVVHNGKIEMVVAMQLSLGAINNIMQQREGLGETGETYLVGPDKLMRSDSFLDPKNHTVKASFANQQKGKVDTDASREALAGKSDAKIVMNYNGNPVLSAYTPVKVNGLQWTLMAEIDEAEALAPVKVMQKIIGLIMLVSSIVIFVIALFLVKMVMAPIKVVVANLKELAQGEGDLTQRLAVDCPNCSDVLNCNESDCSSFGKNGLCWEISGTMSENPDCVEVTSGRITNCEDCEVYKMSNYDELQQLSTIFNLFVLKLQRMFKEVVQGVQTMASATTQLSAIAEQMSGSANNVSDQSNTVATASEEMSSNMNSVAAATEQASTNINTVASAAEEMTSTISDVNASTTKARDVSKEAVDEAQSATIKVQELGVAAKEISKVTEVITNIASQTNLLALNATIEAARAGEAGKGFAVVAHEIKELAQQTAKASGQIKNQIDGIQSSTSSTVTQIEQITGVINNVNDTITGITTAVKEQASATEEISSNVAQAAQGLSEVNENVAESSTVSSQIAKDITVVSQASTEMADSSSEVQNSASELSQLAEKLKNMVGGFKL